MRFTKSGGQTAVGPEAWFVGTVYIDTIRSPDDQSCVGCAHVRFTPGTRTAWHTHPRGQTLYVTDGIDTSVAEVARCKRSVRVTSPTSSRARNTGTAPRLTASWRTSRSRRPTTTARW
jgi:hypothetical protein